MRSRARACARGTAVGGRPATTTCLPHVFPLPARPSARLLTTLLTLCLTAFTDQAHASSAQLPNGLGVVLDRASMTRVGSIAAGQVVDVYVVADDDAPPSAAISLRAYQFGLEIDPRLTFLGVTLPPEVVFPDFPAPRDYVLGLGTCLGASGGHPVLLTAHVVLPPSQAGATDLRVDVRPLTDGREMLFSPCYDAADLRRFQPAGGAVLNPSPPSIVRFAGSPAVLVEGRPLALSWETFGAQGVTLDGAQVAVALTETLAPTADKTWTLAASAGPLSVSSAWSVQVIREPRIDRFTVEPFVSGDQTMARLSWDVQGANEILLDGTQSVRALSGQLVPLKSPAVWLLSATNEWGMTSRTAALDVVNLPPVILQLTATPNPFRVGDTVTLHWAVFGAESASIDQGIGVVDPQGGAHAVQPQGSVTYSLTASNANGTSSASVLVQLLPPGIGLFLAEPAAVFPGDPTTLHWAAEAGSTLRIDPAVGPVTGTSGAVVVTPTQPSTIYVLTATNPSGTVAAEALVTWKPPEATLAVSSGAPYAIDPVTLIAQIRGATQAALEPGIGPIPPAGGQFQLLVEQPTVFVLTASNAAGATTRQVSVTPRTPTATLQASKTTPFPDEPITLTAAVQGAASVTLEPGFGLIPPAGGVFTTTVTTPTNFALTAVNGAGATVQQVTVTPQPPRIVSFRGNPQQLTVGQPGSLMWTVEHAVTVQVEPGGFSGLAASGSVAIDPPQTTTYTLTAMNTAGTSTATTTVERAPFSILSFAATPGIIAPGESITLSWQVIGTANVSIDGYGPQPMAGSMVLHPDVSEVYTLRAQYGSTVRTAITSVIVRAGGTVSGFLAPSWSGTEYPGQAPVIEPFIAFDFYVVALDPPGGMLGYECSVHVPQELIVAGGRTFFPNGGLDVGSGDDNWIVGTGGVCLEGAIVPLIRYAACLFIGPVPAGAQIALGPSTPSSFSEPGLPGRPGYLSCLAAGDLRPFIPGPGLPIGESNPPTPALTLALAAEAADGGIRLRWELRVAGPATGAAVPQSVKLLRRAPGEPPVAVATFSGANSQASGVWIDATALPQVAYRYSAVAQVNGTAVASLEVEAVRDAPGSAIAHQTRLLPNVPNPFNPRTEIRFELARPGTVRLELFDAAGRLVRRVELPAQSTGTHTWTWRGEDDAGNPVGSGVYRVRLTADGGGAAGAADARSITLVR
jgi:hypothetical protein